MSKGNKNDNKTIMLSVIRMCENRNCEILDFCIDGNYCEFKLKIKNSPKN
jgi:hypothetical protein